MKAGWLTAEDLHVLTGYVQYKRQKQWLSKEGIPYRVAATGRPVVLWTEVHHGQKTKKQPTPPSQAIPEGVLVLLRQRKQVDVAR